jgi:hypothetical protein
MEYRGVAYEIRAHLEKNRWNWTIYPAAGVSRKGEITGPRQRAIVAAQQAIDRWLKKNPSAKSNSDNLGNNESPATRPGFFVLGKATGAQKMPFGGCETPKCASETWLGAAEAREHRRFSDTRRIWRRDQTGWLGD